MPMGVWCGVQISYPEGGRGTVHPRGEARRKHEGTITKGIAGGWHGLARGCIGISQEKHTPTRERALKRVLPGQTEGEIMLHRRPMLVTPWSIWVKPRFRIRYRHIRFFLEHGLDAEGRAIIEIIDEADRAVWLRLKPWQMAILNYHQR